MEAQITISPAIAAGSFNFAVFLDFVSKLVDAMAWPAAFILAAYWLRHPVIRLISDLKVKTVRGAGIEAEFESTLEKAEHKTTEITPSADEVQGPSAGKIGKPDENRGRVLKKFAQIDKALENLARALKPEPDMGAGRAQQVGRELIEPSQMAIYKDLRLLRNQAANALEFDLSDELTAQYESVADRLIASINAVASGEA